MMQGTSASGDEGVAFDVLRSRWGSPDGAGPAASLQADSAFNSRLDRFHLSGNFLQLFYTFK